MSWTLRDDRTRLCAVARAEVDDLRVDLTSKHPKPGPNGGAVADYVRLILDELLRYRLSPAAATEGFKLLRHNDDLCPAVERQVNTYLDCALKYHRVAYDVQGPRDRGSDVVLRHGEDEETRFVVMQVKSFHDLKERDYLSRLKAQAFEVHTEYGDQLDHYFILLCTDALEQASQLRNIRKDFATAYRTTVVDPTYVWTFLRLSALSIDAVVEAILKQQDAVYGQARSLVVDSAPLETAILLSLLAHALGSGSYDVRLEHLRSVRFLDFALDRISDIDYEDYFYDDPDEPQEPQKDRGRDADTRIAEALDAMDTDTIVVDPISDVITVNYISCEPLIALMLDAKVRFGYEGSQLARYLFEALRIPRVFGLDFDDQEA